MPTQPLLGVLLQLLGFSLEEEDAPTEEELKRILADPSESLPKFVETFQQLRGPRPEVIAEFHLIIDRTTPLRDLCQQANVDILYEIDTFEEIEVPTEGTYQVIFPEWEMRINDEQWVTNHNRVTTRLRELLALAKVCAQPLRQDLCYIMANGTWRPSVPALQLYPDRKALIGMGGGVVHKPEGALLVRLT